MQVHLGIRQGHCGMITRTVINSRNIRNAAPRLHSRMQHRRARFGRGSEAGRYGLRPEAIALRRAVDKPVGRLSTKYRAFVIQK